MRNLNTVLLFLGTLYVCKGALVNQMVFPDVSTFYTGSKPDYSLYPLSVQDRDFFTFRLRACGQGRVLIHATEKIEPQFAVGDPAIQDVVPMDSSVMATLVILGGPDSSNTITVVDVRNASLILAKATLDEPVLDCGEMRQFWISWRNQTLQIGRGPIFQQQTLLSTINRDARFVDVNMLYFATSDGLTGVWQIDDNAGIRSKVVTPTSVDFPYFWKSVENHQWGFVFSVRADKSAKVALAARSGRADYVFVLGADQNKRISFYKGDELLKTYEEPNQVDGFNYRPFWITWHGGLIELGGGRKPSQQQMLSYQDDYFINVGHVGLAAADGATGDWIVKQDTENELMVMTPLLTGSTDYDFYITAPRSQFVQFYVSGCSDATIVFTTDIEFMDDFSIYITLGAKNNTMTILGTGFTPELETYPGQGLLVCDTPLPFWASWKSNELRLGTGTLLDADLILLYADAIVPKLMVIGFSNSIKTVPVEFTVSDLYGDQMGFVAPPALDYGQIWMTTKEEYFKVFEIMQCGGAQLILTETLAALPNDQYQVLFNADGKTVTIRRGSEGPVYKFSHALECMKKRTFWLTWYNNEVKLGMGYRYGEKELLKLSTGTPYIVNALTVSNSGSQTAMWLINMEKDNILGIKMMRGNSNSGTRWFRLYQDLPWMYFRLSNTGQAVMALSSYYMDEKYITHKVYFGENGKNNIRVARFSKDGNQLETVTGALVLPWDRFNLRDFWISWDVGFVRIGESRLRRDDQIVKIAYDQDFPTMALAFYPEEKEDMEWRVHNSFGPEAYLITEVNQKNLNWVKIKHNLNSLVFRLETCSDATITMSDMMYATELESYIVQLSNSYSMTYIAKNGKSRVFTKIDNLFTCGKEKYFWISWYAGTISVGQSDKIGEQIILTWHDAMPSPINAFTIATQKEPGKWRIGLMGALPPRPHGHSSGGGLSGGAIAGIVIGSLILVVIIALVALIVIKGPPKLRRNNAPDQSFNNPISNQQPEY